MKLPAEAVERFGDCMDAAIKAEEIEPTAMTLATIDGEGGVSARMVLMKSWDEEGFVFYTNTLSIKGRQLARVPRGALVFYWPRIERQVRVEGPVAPVSDAEADAYFATRARGSQLGAWASDQSQPLESRAHLMKKVVELELRHVGRSVPRPAHWSGYRVRPEMIEFWYGRRSRLHDRFRFTSHGGEWDRQRLYP
jgi:pyridoxamine 5'-phosphate oxidase